MRIRFSPTVRVPAARAEVAPLAAEMAGLAAAALDLVPVRDHSLSIMSRARACVGARPPPPHRARRFRSSRAHASASRRSPRSSPSSSPGAAPLRSSVPIRSSRARTASVASMTTTLAGALQRESNAFVTKASRSERALRRLREPRRGPQPEQHVVQRAHERDPVAVPQRGSTSARRTDASARSDAGSPFASARSEAWIARRSSLSRRAAPPPAAPTSPRARRPRRRAAARSGTARSGRARAPSGRAPRRARGRRRRAGAARAARAPRRRGTSRAASARPAAASQRSEARADPEGAPVEPLEEHRPRGDGRRRREAQRSDGIGELGRRIRRLRPASSARSSSRTQSGRRPGRSPAAAGPAPRASAARARPSPLRGRASRSPSSTCVTTEIPSSGATAAYARAEPKSERSSSA